VKKIATSAEHASVELSIQELRIINNALNEVCNGLDIHEFATRMGANREDAEMLLERVGSLIDTMRSM